MIRLDSLIADRGFRELAPRAAVDPFRVDGALSEAQVLDVRLDALRGRLAVLLDIRFAECYDGVNCGFIAVEGVESFRWSAERRYTSFTAWNVVGSQPRLLADGLEFSLEMSPDAELKFRGAKARFCIGFAPAHKFVVDYGTASDDEVDRDGIGWDSMMELVSWAEASTPE